MKICLEYSNKRRYNTKKDAETAILLISAVSLRIYECFSCNGWHLTSKID